MQPSPARLPTGDPETAAAHHPSAADSVRAAHGEAPRPAKGGRAHTAEARKGLFPGPRPAPAWSAPPRPSGLASYLHGPDQAPAGELALPQLQQNVSGSRPAAPSAPSRHRCRRPSPSAGPRPSRRRRRRHVSSSDKQEASGPRAAVISTGRQRGRRSAPSGPSAEAQDAWQGPCAPRGLLGNVVLVSGGAGAMKNFPAPVVFRAPRSGASARSGRSRTSPTRALSHFLSVWGSYHQLAWKRSWAPGQESSHSV